MTARMIMKLEVVGRTRDTESVDVITLRHPLRPELPAWTPGSHVDVRLPDGKVRQYSLCGNPADLSTYRIAVKREENGRGGSAWIHENFAIGTIAHVSAPRTNFGLAPDASRHVFIAGGIGVTPIAPMVRAARDKGDRYELHFCARAEALAPLLPELRAELGTHLKTYFSDTNRFDAAALVASLPANDPSVHLYGCGPIKLTDAVRGAADASGWPEHRVHFEVFQATLDENFKPEPFDATLASTGETLRIPADRSILDVLRERGFALPSSCELGVCGTCVCGYRDGVVIHRDSVLSTAERQDRMMLCVSRARVHVTLDL